MREAERRLSCSGESWMLVALKLSSRCCEEVGPGMRMMLGER